MCAGSQEQRHSHPDRVSWLHCLAPTVQSPQGSPLPGSPAASELQARTGSPQTPSACYGPSSVPGMVWGRVGPQRRGSRGPGLPEACGPSQVLTAWEPAGPQRSSGRGGRCGCGAGAGGPWAPLRSMVPRVHRLRPVKEMAQSHEYLSIEYSEEEVWLTWTDKNNEHHEKSVRQLAQEARAGNAHDENVLSYYRCPGPPGWPRPGPALGRAPAASGGAPPSSFTREARSGCPRSACWPQDSLSTVA